MNTVNTKDKTVKIDPCPHCDGSHVFKYEVDEIYVMGLFGLNKPSKPKKKKFYLTGKCPGTTDLIDITITIPEKVGTEIKGVKIGDCIG